jgi:hypothetical protein
VDQVRAVLPDVEVIDTALIPGKCIPLTGMSAAEAEAATAIASAITLTPLLNPLDVIFKIPQF